MPSSSGGAGQIVYDILVFIGAPWSSKSRLPLPDFVILDMEHSALDLDRAGHLLRAWHARSEDIGLHRY